MEDLPANHPLYGSEQSKSGFGISYQFAIKCPVFVSRIQCLQGFAGFVSYSHSMIRKDEHLDVISMTAKLSKDIAAILRAHEDYFNGFDRIAVYYDNGQVELTKILTSVFNALFGHVEFRKVKPVDYKLFQVADLICTMELMSEKFRCGRASDFERDFFGGERDFKKNYLKPLVKKRF